MKCTSIYSALVVDPTLEIFILGIAICRINFPLDLRIKFNEGDNLTL